MIIAAHALLLMLEVECCCLSLTHFLTHSLSHSLTHSLILIRFDAGGVSIIDFPDGARQGVGGVLRTQNYTAHLGR